MIVLIIRIIIIMSIIIEVKEIHKHTREIEELKARIKYLEQKRP